MLGVFLLLAFTHLRHECQESMGWNACVHRLELDLNSHPKEFWGNGVRTHVNSKGKIPSTRKNSPQRIELKTLHQAQYITNKLFRRSPLLHLTLNVLYRTLPHTPCNPDLHDEYRMKCSTTIYLLKEMIACSSRFVYG